MIKSNFGWFEKLPNAQWSFIPQQKMQGWRKITEFSDQPMIKFGNDFGKTWLDHTQTPHDVWWFYDNPELSIFTYRTNFNPRGNKSWIRLTPGDIFTTPERAKPGGTAHINQQLTEIVGTPQTWHDYVMPRSVERPNARLVLICPSSPNCHHYYYGVSQKRWIQQQIDNCAELGLDYEVWYKPTRPMRAHHTQYRLYTRLQAGDVLCTVSQHSAAALETITAGVPAVVMGHHGTGPLGTTPEEFYRDGYLRECHQDDVERWLDCVLLNTYNKKYMETGLWHG